LFLLQLKTAPSGQICDNRHAVFYFNGVGYAHLTLAKS
jgi:hypothetical protein